MPPKRKNARQAAPEPEEARPAKRQQRGKAAATTDQAPGDFKPPPGKKSIPGSEREVIDLSNNLPRETTHRTAFPSTGGFPRFADGEAYICLVDGRSKYHYQLHASVLRRASTWFALDMEKPRPEEPDFDKAARLTKRVNIAGRYELRLNNDIGLEVLKRVSLTKYVDEVKSADSASMSTHTYGNIPEISKSMCDGSPSSLPTKSQKFDLPCSNAQPGPSAEKKNDMYVQHKGTMKIWQDVVQKQSSSKVRTNNSIKQEAQEIPSQYVLSRKTRDTESLQLGDMAVHAPSHVPSSRLAKAGRPKQTESNNSTKTNPVILTSTKPEENMGFEDARMASSSNAMQHDFVLPDTFSTQLANQREEMGMMTGEESREENPSLGKEIDLSTTKEESSEAVFTDISSIPTAKTLRVVEEEELEFNEALPNRKPLNPDIQQEGTSELLKMENNHIMVTTGSVAGTSEAELTEPSEDLQSVLGSNSSVIQEEYRSSESNTPGNGPDIDNATSDGNGTTGVQSSLEGSSSSVVRAGAKVSDISRTITEETASLRAIPALEPDGNEAPADQHSILGSDSAVTREDAKETAMKSTTPEDITIFEAIPEPEHKGNVASTELLDAFGSSSSVIPEEVNWPTTREPIQKEVAADKAIADTKLDLTDELDDMSSLFGSNSTERELGGHTISPVGVLDSDIVSEFLERAEIENQSEVLTTAEAHSMHRHDLQIKLEPEDQLMGDYLMQMECQTTSEGSSSSYPQVPYRQNSGQAMPPQYDGCGDEPPSSLPGPSNYEENKSGTSNDRSGAKPSKRSHLIIEALDNLFRIFYSMPPLIDTDNISKARSQVEWILHVAIHYGSLPVVRPYLNNCLLQFGHDLFRAIPADPPGWLLLSIHLESAPIFKEAIIHTVGQHPKWGTESRMRELPAAVLKLLDATGRDLEDKENKIKELLFCQHLNTSENKFHLDFSSIMEWSTAFVRQQWREWYLTSLMRAKCKSEDQKFATAEVYRTMARSGEAYLPARSLINCLENFNRRGDINKIDKDSIEEELKKLKDYAEKVVQPLCENFSLLSPERENISYFTCIEVENQELPWFNADVRR